MSTNCGNCHSQISGNPLYCPKCGITLRKQKLNTIGRVLMTLLVTGLVLTVLACIRLIYLCVTDPGYSFLTCSWQVGLWFIGFYVYMKFLGLFEGFVRPC